MSSGKRWRTADGGRFEPDVAPAGCPSINVLSLKFAYMALPRRRHFVTKFVEAAHRVSESLVRFPPNSIKMSCNEIRSNATPDYVSLEMVRRTIVVTG